MCPIEGWGQKAKDIWGKIIHCLSPLRGRAKISVQKHTSLELGKRSKKVSQNFTYIANKYTSKLKYSWRKKIFLTWNFREIAIWKFFPKKSHHKNFSKSFFWKSIWIHMIFDLYLLYKILIFFKNFTKNFQNFLWFL